MGDAEKVITDIAGEFLDFALTMPINYAIAGNKIKEIFADIWDEIKESKELESVSDEDKSLLLNRLAHYRTNPESATDWRDLRQGIYEKYSK